MINSISMPKEHLIEDEDLKRRIFKMCGKTIVSFSRYLYQDFYGKKMVVVFLLHYSDGTYENIPVEEDCIKANIYHTEFIEKARQKVYAYLTRHLTYHDRKMREIFGDI